MPVVSMQPEGEFLGASIRVGIGLGVGPFAQGGLDEALSLAIGLWGIGLGADVFEAEIAAGVTEVERPVARAVVAHHPGYRDAEALIVGQGCLQEGGGALFLLVGHDLGESDARGVVDADMDKLPADAAAVALAGAVAGDAMTDPLEAAELFDVEVDHLARGLALVASDRHDRVKRLQLVQPKSFENPTDGCRRDARRLGDLLADPALAAQGFDLLSGHLRGWPVEAVRPRGTIGQANGALGREAFDPLADRLGRHTHGCGYDHRRLPCNQYPPHQLGSTVRRQAGILVHVHPVPPWTLKPRNLSFLGQDRVDNLLRAHS